MVTRERIVASDGMSASSVIAIKSVLIATMGGGRGIIAIATINSREKKPLSLGDEACVARW